MVWIGRIPEEVIEFVSMDNININICLSFKLNCWITENNLQCMVYTFILCMACIYKL